MAERKKANGGGGAVNIKRTKRLSNRSNLLKKQMNTEEERHYLGLLAKTVARKGCRFLEIGSWCGDSTSILGKVAQTFGGQVVAVDWWRGNPGTELEKVASKNNILEHFQRRIKKEGLQDTVVPLVTTSNQAANLLREGQFDLIFIDGDHRYSQVLLDINNFSPLLNEQGGIFCGHDCDGNIKDFDTSLLEKGKDVDVYKKLHCGVILGVGRSFRDYNVKSQIWSMFSSKTAGWHPIDVKITPKNSESPLKFDLGAYSISRSDGKFFAIPKQIVGRASTSGTDEQMLLKPFGGAIEADSFQKISELLLKIRSSSSSATFVETPIICEEHDNANIVSFGNIFYVIEKRIGEINFISPNAKDLAIVKDGLREQTIVVADNIVEARSRLTELALTREKLTIGNKKAGLERDLAVELSKTEESRLTITALRSDLKSSEKKAGNFERDLAVVLSKAEKARSELEETLTIERTQAEKARSELERDLAVELSKTEESRLMIAALRSDLKSSEGQTVELKTEILKRQKRFQLIMQNANSVKNNKSNFALAGIKLLAVEYL